MPEQRAKYLNPVKTVKIFKLLLWPELKFNYVLVQRAILQMIGKRF